MQYEFTKVFSRSGSHQISVKHEGEKNETEAQYIVVEPNAGIKLTEMKMVTLISRCVGKFERWPLFLSSVAETGYNAIHFAPI